MKSGLSGNILKAAIAIAAIAVVMGFTNPRKERYLDYASAKLATDIQSAICSESLGEAANQPDILRGITNLFTNICKTGIDLQRGTIRKIIDDTTRQQDFLVLSVYKTEVPRKKYTTIAAFGNFMTFESSEDSQ